MMKYFAWWKGKWEIGEYAIFFVGYKGIESAKWVNMHGFLVSSNSMHEPPHHVTKALFMLLLLSWLMSPTFEALELGFGEHNMSINGQVTCRDSPIPSHFQNNTWFLNVGTCELLSDIGHIWAKASPKLNRKGVICYLF